MKILFNYQGQNQRCNCRLVHVESQLRASTTTGSNTAHSSRSVTSPFRANFLPDRGAQEALQSDSSCIILPADFSEFCQRRAWVFERARVLLCKPDSESCNHGGRVPRATLLQRTLLQWAQMNNLLDVAATNQII